MEWLLLALKRWNDFDGRSRRMEFWMFVLAVHAACIMLFVLEMTLYGVPFLTFFIALGSFLPACSVAIRRLHDIGWSGWWVLLSLTGVGSFVLLVLFLQDSRPGYNVYGPSPKYG